MVVGAAEVALHHLPQEHPAVPVLPRALGLAPAGKDHLPDMTLLRVQKIDADEVRGAVQLIGGGWRLLRPKDHGVKLSLFMERAGLRLCQGLETASPPAGPLLGVTDFNYGLIYQGVEHWMEISKAGPGG